MLKPVNGAGSQDTYMVSGPYDAPPAYAWPRRLESYVPGLAASVAMLCGPGGRISLAPCKQRISDDGRLRYLGGEMPLAAGLAERARSLAERALAAMPPAVGYVGVDLVLGREPDGSQDAVIEINPRLTTSYVGLRTAATSNLAEAMWRVAQGEMQPIEFSERADRIRCERECELSAMSWLGIDIGGANLKAADGRGWARSVPFALWRNPQGLARAVRRSLLKVAQRQNGWP